MVKVSSLINTKCVINIFFICTVKYKKFISPLIYQLRRTSIFIFDNYNDCKGSSIYLLFVIVRINIFI